LLLLYCKKKVILAEFNFGKMLFRRLYKFHEQVKSNWIWLTLTSYITTALLTIGLHNWQPGQKGMLLDGYLTALAGILTTIVVTTFSFVFVALQLASVQFSPRIIRSFFEYDHFSRFFLWSFLACVGYLMGLQYFGWSEASLIYPKFGIVGSFYLILMVFPLFIHHIVGNINASSITQNIARRTIEEIDELYESLPFFKAETGKLQLLAPESGYLDSIRYEALEALFPLEKDVKMTVRPHIGSFVIKGGLLAEIDCPPALRDFYAQLTKPIQACFVIDKFRSYKQDIPFGIRQLVDIAIKAISPAVNDPTTALNCIDYLGTIIQRAAQSEANSREAKLLSQKNIHIREFSFEQLVDLAFDQIYFWGKEDYIVVRHLLKTITNLLPFMPSQDKLKVLIRQVEDFELQYLHDEDQKGRLTSTFPRKEHRNSLRDHLFEFYKEALEVIGEKAPDAGVFSGRQEQFRSSLKALAKCYE
jgi:uncharacterized membrane protein